MRSYFLILLALLLLFGCGTEKVEDLNDRFELVNGTLEWNISTESKSNDLLFQKLKSNDQKKLQVVKDHSKGIVNYLNKLKDVLVEKSGGRDPETGMLVGADDFDLPYNFVSRSIYRRTLKDTVNSIVNELNSLSNMKEFALLVMDGKADPYWSQMPNIKTKTAIHLLFENVNISGALTSISQIQLRVLEYERVAYETVLLQELDSLRGLHQ